MARDLGCIANVLKLLTEPFLSDKTVEIYSSSPAYVDER